MGGIAIDENANILDEDNLPIQGLYGAGDMAVGSLYGDPSNAGGNVHGSMPSGLLAGVLLPHMSKEVVSNENRNC